ncbi:MAG: hypothetical protein KKF88_00490 [Alphaproteobacteria bacterium]|nr:hypothetical protein [Alphaproteobacteria bacterium]
MYRVLMVAMVTACTAALAQPAQAQTAVAGGDLTFVVGAEVSHDSSVVFLSDTGFADEPDQSLALSGNARFRRGVGTNGRFSLSYGLTSTSYLEASSRDNLLNIVTASYSHSVGQASLGASYSKAWSSLDGDAFLELQSTSLFFGAPAPMGWVVVGRVSRTEKDFEAPLAFRDADADALGVTASRRFGATGVQMGLSFIEEDAVADILDFGGYTARGSISQPLLVMNQMITADLSLSYEERDYETFDPAIGAIRADERTRLGLTFTRDFLTGLSLEASASHRMSRSNLPSADYDQTSVGVAARYRF